MESTSLLGMSLFAFGVGGVIGVLIDLDHFIEFRGKRGRYAHKSIFIVSVIAICVLGSLAGGQILEFVLRG